jgi:hypothetical protein
MKALAAVLLLALVAAVVMQRVPSGNASEPPRASVWASETTFTVINQGLSAYRIDGVNNPMITLYRGQTCNFNVSAEGHPFYIKTMRTTGAGNQYPNGVTGQGEEIGTVVFVVPSDAPSTLFYQCGVHSAMGGTFNIQTPLDVGPGRGAESVRLGPAMPNPVRQEATFAYSLPRAARVYFALFDERGRRLRTLSDGVKPAGEHIVRWDGRDDRGRVAPSGIYFYRLRAEGRSLTGQLVIAH